MCYVVFEDNVAIKYSHDCIFCVWFYLTYDNAVIKLKDSAVFNEVI